ncbi:MAG: glycosyltransferase family 4 protein [Candidatus Nitrosocaldus sp.]
MKILHICEYDYYKFIGGIPKYVKELSEIQASHNDVTVFSCSKDKSYEVINNVKIKRFSYFELLRVPISLSMCIAFLTIKTDIVHIHHTYPIVGEIISILAKLRGIPIIATIHNEPHLLNNSFATRIAYNIWKYVLVKISFSLSNILIATTKDFADTSDILKDFKDKLHVIPIGIHNNIKKRVYKKDEDYLLFVGRIVPEKGLHILIEALRDIDKNIILKIVGDYSRSDEISYKKKLDDMIEEYRLHHRVRFLGRVSDAELDLLYDNARALVMPVLTRSDSFGIVQLEAMIHGLPIITSNIAGVREVAYGAAILVEPNNPKALADAIIKILDNKVRDELSRITYEVSKRYEWSNIYKEIEYIYAKILK